MTNALQQRCKLSREIYQLHMHCVTIDSFAFKLKHKTVSYLLPYLREPKIYNLEKISE